MSEDKTKLKTRDERGRLLSDDELLEAAYWRFDALTLGIDATAERDAFKMAVRQYVAATREKFDVLVYTPHVPVDPVTSKPTSVTCPKCTRVSTHVLMPATDNTKRRVARYHECECGVVIRLGTREGWERWCALDWAPSPAEIREPRHLPDRQAFYDRVGK